MPKCKDAIAINRPTCIKDPAGAFDKLSDLQRAVSRKQTVFYQKQA